MEVEGWISGSIAKGYLILLGVGREDSDKTAQALASKIAKLRLMGDPEKESKAGFDLDIREAEGQALVVSQFTLHADTKKGRRPSFSQAARPEQAEVLYEHFCQALADQGVTVRQGVFGAMMKVHLVNDGPVTINLEIT